MVNNNIGIRSACVKMFHLWVVCNLQFKFMSPRAITVTNGRRLDGWMDGRIGGVKVRASVDAGKPSADIVDSFFHQAARELRVNLGFHGHYKFIFVHPVCLNGNPYPF